MAGVQALAEQARGRPPRLRQPGDLQRPEQAGSRSPTSPATTGDGNVRADYANGIDATAGILYSVRTFNQDSSLTGRRAGTT